MPGDDDLKPLPVDLDEVIEAMEHAADSEFTRTRCYLDTRTGEVVSVDLDGLEDWDDDDDDEDGAGDWPAVDESTLTPRDREVREAILAGDPAFEEIPPEETRESYRIMEDFVGTVPDPRLRDRLERAIQGKGAFRRFKDTLFDNLAEREHWFDFERDAKRQWAVDWLESLGIGTTWEPPVKARPAQPPTIIGIHHAQITIPRGQEERGRFFYCQVLGFTEIEKPESLQGRGGFWLQLPDGLQLHVGTEDGVDRSATKAHLALQVTNLAGWRKALEEMGLKVLDSAPIPGFDRFEFRDPFGNRMELITPIR